MTSPDHMLYVTLCVEAFHGMSKSFQVGGYWLCAHGDIKYLICQVTSPNHVIKGSCNFMCGNSSLTTLVATFGGHSHCNIRDVFSLFARSHN